jgi:hypothetical protein
MGIVKKIRSNPFKKGKRIFLKVKEGMRFIVNSPIDKDVYVDATTEVETFCVQSLCQKPIIANKQQKYSFGFGNLRFRPTESDYIDEWNCKTGTGTLTFTCIDSMTIELLPEETAKPT